MNSWVCCLLLAHKLETYIPSKFTSVELQQQRVNDLGRVQCTRPPKGALRAPQTQFDTGIKEYQECVYSSLPRTSTVDLGLPGRKLVMEAASKHSKSLQLPSAVL